MLRLIPLIAALIAAWLVGWLPVECALGVVPMFLLPSCSCCTSTTVSCGNNCNTGTAHSQVQLTVSGITNGTCTDCANLNGTFIMDVQILGGTCASWRISLPITGYCDTSGLHPAWAVTFGLISAPTAFAAEYFSNFGVSAHYSGPTTFPIDCAFVAQSFTYFSDTGLCTFSGSTVTADAI